MKERNISENYLFAQEIISGIGKPTRGGNVLLKLDISKAYDCMSWFFIVQVLRKFGFGERFIDMVWRLVFNVWFSIIVNGAPYDFFKSTRGLRQGDSLSLALLVIGAKVLSRGLNNLASQLGFLRFKVPNGCPQLTHLAFADDILIFANESTAPLKKIMKVLDSYQKLSGQLLNVQKSGYLAHPSLSHLRQRVIEHITGFHQQHFPAGYLGFPLYFGRCKASYYGEVRQAIMGRIRSWKSKLLSLGGKVILIKHVLSSIPIHLLSPTIIPSVVFLEIEQAYANSLWGGSQEG